jgi:hypothetical protein
MPSVSPCSVDGLAEVTGVLPRNGLPVTPEGRSGGGEATFFPRSKRPLRGRELRAETEPKGGIYSRG